MSPEWSFALHPSYEFALGGGGTLTLTANAVYKGEQFHSEFNDERMSSEAYTLVDANILFTSASERYTVNLWGKNLTDEFVWAGSYAVASTRTIGGTLLPPRTYGVTVSVKLLILPSRVDREPCRETGRGFPFGCQNSLTNRSPNSLASLLSITST